MKRLLVIAGLGIAALALSPASSAADQASSAQVAASFERMLAQASVAPAQPFSSSRDEDPLLRYVNAALWDGALSRCAFASKEVHAAARIMVKH